MAYADVLACVEQCCDELESSAPNSRYDFALRPAVCFKAARTLDDERAIVSLLFLFGFSRPPSCQIFF
jgi:hypothetical protein